jgi:D-lactate dehydrogenase
VGLDREIDEMRRTIMKVAVFDAHRFEQGPLTEINRRFGHELAFLEPRLTPETAPLARGFPVVCSFANDHVDARTLRILQTEGVQLIALRTAGFNHVDLAEAARLGIKVVRVPAYSPYSVAEHAACLILALNRKIHRAYARVRELNFSLDGLVGFDLHGKTVGVIGTGRIGAAFCRIMAGFGCQVLAHDVKPNAELSEVRAVTYTDLPKVFDASDIISLHVPLTPETKHLIDNKALARMRKGVMLINTGRGALIETQSLVTALKSGHVGSAGLDVYEEEENVFFQDLSGQVLQDDTLARLLTFPNVLVTSHQAFLTEEALHNIAETTLENIRDFEKKRPLKNEVKPR